MLELACSFLSRYHWVQTYLIICLKTSHTAHAKVKLWHLHRSFNDIQVQCWLLTLAGKALCCRNLDSNIQAWSDPCTHLWVIPWPISGCFVIFPISILHPSPTVCAWSLSKSCLHWPASLQLTMSSIIEPKRGACFHCLRNFISRDTFLWVKGKERAKKVPSFSSPTLYFLHSTNILGTPMCQVFC
jgi:hypothetical protein